MMPQVCWQQQQGRCGVPHQAASRSLQQPSTVCSSRPWPCTTTQLHHKQLVVQAVSLQKPPSVSAWLVCMTAPCTSPPPVGPVRPPVRRLLGLAAQQQQCCHPCQGLLPASPAPCGPPPAVAVLEHPLWRPHPPLSRHAARQACAAAAATTRPMAARPASTAHLQHYLTCRAAETLTYACSSYSSGSKMSVVVLISHA